MLIIGIIFLVSPCLYAKELGRLKVLTYNIDGVIGAQKRHERAKKIGEEAARLNPDIIGFQEAYDQSHRDMIMQALEQSGWGKPFEYYDKNHYGPGVWIVSKYPVTKGRMGFYPVNGPVYDPDFFGSNGAGYAQVQTPWGPVDFFNTHLLARYGALYDKQGRLLEQDPTKTDRVLQVEYYSKFIQDLNRSSGSRSLVAMGDFNSPAVLIEYKLFQALSGLESVEEKLALENCEETIRECRPGSRLDHIFYQNYAGETGFYLKPVRAELVFYEKVKVGTKMMRLSDHNGIFTEFAVMSVEDLSAQVAERERAEIWLLSKDLEDKRDLLKDELERRQVKVSDRAWQIFAVKAMDKMNARKFRKSEVPVALAQVIIGGQAGEALLSADNLKQMEFAWSFVFGLYGA